MVLQQQLQILLDKQAITEVMYKFARALDRVDGELMKSTYWEDAIEEHQDPIFPDLFFYNDNAHAFVAPAMEGFKALKATQHRISNPLIEVKGDTANAEAYVWAYHVHEENGVDKEGILGGRHHFRFERRQGEWKIIHRNTVFDWNQNLTASAIWADSFEDKYRGKRDKTDASYQYLSF
ncbi:nuclear transport factor 2 family protein [Shewanella submarina]|uniref:Nuclear transport factor 2 family protein n=1 Tax=Shewanella submarina TaxID=2016376 RepID=A0ABV7G6R5_9GAMM|nr:nuclear transport factor 2 family protein [Shewanella submarina]MCL1037422.1 nuclear transport factor 2 family protein [Shewanella submarina]